MLRAAVIGLRHGHVGEFVRAVQLNSEVQLVGVAEDHPELAAKAKSDYGVPVYATYQELLEREQPQVACVVTTNATKYQALVACLERNIHVIADKPLLTSLSQLAQVEQAFQRSSARLSMTLSYRYTPAVRALKQLIAAGTLGDLVHIYGAGPHKLRPQTRRPWELDARQNGGVHHIDVMRWLSSQEPRRVAAVQGNLRFRELPHFYDHAQALWEFSRGMKGLLTADWLTPDAAPYHGDYRIYVTGTRGTAEYSATGQRTGPQASATVRVALVDKEPYDLEIPPAGHGPSSDLLDALVTKREPELSGEEVLRTMRAILHAVLAAEKGTWVEVPA